MISLSVFNISLKKGAAFGDESSRTRKKAGKFKAHPPLAAYFSLLKPNKEKKMKKTSGSRLMRERRALRLTRAKYEAGREWIFLLFSFLPLYFA